MSRPRTTYDMHMAIAKHYGISYYKARKITPAKLEQLRLCKDEESRRMLIFVWPWVRAAK